MNSGLESSIEFAAFLADVSDPATGAIRADRLARRLRMGQACLEEGWRRSGIAPWSEYASCILAILDMLQDMTFCLERSVCWCESQPLACAGGKTVTECLARGEVYRVLAVVRELRKRGRTLDSAAAVDAEMRREFR